MRFLKSKFSHKFGENRKKKIKSIKNYIKENKQNLLINDEFISFSLNYARRKNFNSYVLDQINNYYLILLFYFLIFQFFIFKFNNFFNINYVNFLKNLINFLFYRLNKNLYVIASFLFNTYNRNQ